MATQRAAAPLPALTTAHQQQLHLLIEWLSAQGDLPESDLELLRHLAGDLPRFRSYIPAETRAALQELDQNETALNGALDDLCEAIQAFQPTFERNRIAAPHLLDAALMHELSQRAYAISQAAAELALRGQQRVEMLGCYSDSKAIH
jgi:hypothetical protein